MKQNTLIKTLALLSLLSLVAVTVNDYEGFSISKVRYNFTPGADHQRIILYNDYYSLTLRLDDCEDRDIYEFCLENLTYGPVEFYPGTHEAEITYDNICDDDCVALGTKCREDYECGGVCVHDICLPSDPWCGDDYCDDNETCIIDCGEPIINETLPEINETINETVVVNETPEVVEEPEEVIEETVEVNETVETTAETTPEETPEEPEEPEEVIEIQNTPPLTNNPNYLGAGLVILFGILGIGFLFWKKKQKRKSIDDYFFK